MGVLKETRNLEKNLKIFAKSSNFSLKYYFSNLSPDSGWRTFT